MLKQKIIYLLFLVFFSYCAKAQKFDIDTIQYQGTTKNMVNLVVLGDGYTQAELAKFEQDGRRFKDYLFNQHPFSSYKNFFNVFLIKVVSLESGVKHANNAADCPKGQIDDSVKVSGNRLSTKTPMAKSNPNNYFGSSFDNAGLHRLVVAHNKDAIKQVLKDNFPEYSQVLIMVNSPYYGGSGGLFSTATTNFASNAIAIHELGHSFANLADEYWPGLQFLSESANRSQHVESLPWQKWIGTQGIGVYSYGGADPKSVWYRPHEYCKMQYLVAPFCAVCSEAIINKIYTIVNPIVRALPNNDKVLNADSLSSFKLKLAIPSPNTLKVEWLLNNRLIVAQIDSIQIDPGILNTGQNTLIAQVRDTTTFVRGDTTVYRHLWTISLQQEVELKVPLARWGDTLTTCYNGNAVLTVMKAKAGITYKWYDDKKAKVPIATGSNFVSSKLDKQKAYYLEGTFGKKKSERKEVVVKVLDEINIPEIKFLERDKSKADTIVISVLNPDSTLNYKWYRTEKDLIPIFSFQENEDSVKFIVNNAGTLFKIPATQENFSLFIEASSKTTTCRSKRKQVIISK